MEYQWAGVISEFGFSHVAREHLLIQVLLIRAREADHIS